ncbi:MAG: hypothetical protein IOD12_02385 [Silvanigrellales bacterium]|nr:hypothetical protein [Silvanigrellales bacterium]
MTPLGTYVGIGRTTAIAMSFAGIVFASSSASNARAVEVRLFPSGEAKNAEQVRLEFSAPVVVPSEKMNANPASVDSRCGTGTGTWLDEKTWAFTFQEPVAGGLLCEVALDPSFAARTNVFQKGTLSFHTGGPAVEETRPYEHGVLDEDTVLAVGLSARAQSPSIAANVSLVAEDIASPISVSPFIPEAQALRQLFLYDEGFKAKFDAGRVVFLRPSTTLPPGRKITLRWGAGVLSAESGLPTSKTQEITFQVRSPFHFKVECSRENAKSGCVPVAPIEVSFNAEVPWEKAAQVRLVRLLNELTSAPLSGPPKEVRPRKEPGVSPLSNVFRVTFAGPFPPDSQWRVVFPGDFRDDSGRTLEALPRSASSVVVGPVPVLAKFQGAFGLVEAADPIVPVFSRALEKQVTLREKHITSADLSRNPALAFRWHGRVQDAKHEASIFTAQETTRVRSFPLAAMSAPLPNPAQAPAFGANSSPFAVNVVGLPLEGRGLHILELESRILGETLLGETPPGKPKPFSVASAALVTDLALHVKTGRTQGLAWVTSLATAHPVRGASVLVVDCEGTRLPGTYTTDHRGLVSFPLPRNSNCEGEKRLFWSGVGVVATLQNDVTFAHSGWDAGLERWRFHSESSDDPGSSAAWGHEDGATTVSEEQLQPVAAVLDRTLLRAGETLHVALSAWAPRTSKLVASRLPKTLEIRHLGSGEATRFPVSWNTRGFATLAIPFPETQKRGAHDVSLLGQKDERQSVALVRVEDFKVPTSRAFLSLPATDVWKKGATLAGTVQVEYLSGGTPAGKEVEVALHLEPENGRSLQGSRGYLFATRALSPGLRRTDEPQDTNIKSPPFTAQKIRLSAQGMASVSATANEKEALFLRAHLEARYDDMASGRRQTAHFVDYAPATSVVGISTRNDVVLAGSAALRGKVVDPKGRPVNGAKVVFAVASRESYSVRKKMLGGFYAYESYVKLGVPEDVCQAVTDAKGLATCIWKAPEGTWSVEARHVAKEGLTTRASTELSVYGEKPIWHAGDESDRVTLVSDKESYRPGETARIRFESPFQKAQALVTLETGDVLDAFVVGVASKKPIVDVPLDGRHAPNVKVSLLLQRARLIAEKRPGPGEVDLAKPSVRMGVTSLVVERVEQTLFVELSANAAEYPVRGKGTVRVRVRSERGAGNGAARGAGSGAEGVDAQADAPPADTRVTVFAVDEALLDLEPNGTPAVLAQLLPQRSHSVDTATNLSFLLGRRHFGQKARATGGGGGRLSTRELFDTLLFWKPHLPVDAQGNVEVPFTLNDSLTRFRLFASAVSPSTRKAGFGETSLATRQDVLLLPRMPLAVREGDVFQVEFLARNNSGRAWTLEPRVEVEGGDILLPGQNPPLPMQNSSSIGASLPLAPITLEPGAETLIHATLRAHPLPRGGQQKKQSDSPQGSAQAVKVTLTLRTPESATSLGSSPSQRVLDALTARVPVQPLGRLRSLASSVDSVSVPKSQEDKKSHDAKVSKPTIRRDFRFDDNATFRELTVSVSPVGVGDASKLAAYLTSYPYSCTEQLLSKAVVVEDDAGKAWTAFVNELVSRRLAENGHVKYFSGEEEGSPFLTATLLVTASAWKRPLPKEIRERLFGALRQSLLPKAGEAPLSFSTRILLLEAFARAGEPLSHADVRIAFTPETLAWSDFATLLSAGLSSALAAGNPDLAKMGRELLASLPNRLTRAGGSWDLRSEPGLRGAAAQAVRAKLIVTLLEARATGAVATSKSSEGLALSALLASLGRAHALASGAVQSPGTEWSVWGLLAAHKFSKAGIEKKDAANNVGFPWELRRENEPVFAQGEAHPFQARGPFEKSFRLSEPGAYAFTLSAVQAEKGSTSFQEALVFSHVRTNAPVRTAEHRGLRVKCTASVGLSGSTPPSQGDTVNVLFGIRAQAPQEWTVVEIPLPPGAQVLAVSAPSTPGSSHRVNPSVVNSVASPAFVEKTALAVRLWYDELPEGEAQGEVSFLLGTRGQFNVPGCHAEVMKEPDVSSSLPAVPWTVK